MLLASAAACTRSNNITVRYDSARGGKQPVYIVFGMKIPLINNDAVLDRDVLWYRR